MWQQNAKVSDSVKKSEAYEIKIKYVLSQLLMCPYLLEAQIPSCDLSQVTPGCTVDLTYRSSRLLSTF